MPTKNRLRSLATIVALCHLAVLRLEAGNDTVSITTDPPGATVDVNGKVIGTTPLQWKVGNWALNPKKSWLVSKRLETPLRMTLTKDGFLPRTIQLTGNPLRWISANRMNSFVYFVIQSANYNVKLDKVGDFIGTNPFNVLGASTAPAAKSEPSIEGMISRARAAVVTLTTDAGSGSGFFVTRTGVVVTNKHVVGSSPRVRVINAAGRMFDTESVFTDPDHDLALVRVDCADCPNLILADPATINVGQEVIAIGSPGLAGMTFQNTVTKGIVSAFRGPNESGHVYLQTDAQVSPGNSGGPLLNRYGHVVGVNTMKIVEDGYAGLNFAISSNDVLAMLARRFELQAPRGRPEAERSDPDQSSAAMSATSGSAALRNEDILKLKAAGFSDDVIIAKIKSSSSAFRIETDDLINLKQAGLSDLVVKAILEAHQLGK